jgi:hypothetical protein
MPESDRAFPQCRLGTTNGGSRGTAAARNVDHFRFADDPLGASERRFIE